LKREEKRKVNVDFSVAAIRGMRPIFLSSSYVIDKHVELIFFLE